jgi:hypothetical protein
MLEIKEFDQKPKLKDLVNQYITKNKAVTSIDLYKHSRGFSAFIFHDKNGKNKKGTKSKTGEVNKPDSF